MNPEDTQPAPVAPAPEPLTPPPPSSVPEMPLGGVPTVFNGASPPSSPAAPAPTTFGTTSSPSASSFLPKKNRKKLLIAAAGGSVLIIVLVLGTVFGYYLPNKPANVYRTGMKRTGKAVHGLVLGATTDEKLQQIKKSEISGSLEASFSAQTYSGKFNVKLDPTKTNGTFEVNVPDDGQNQKVSAEFMTELASDARFPDLFFRVNGIKALTGGLAAAGGPDIGQYDNKWIAVESKYLETLDAGAGFSADAPKNRENISSQEIAQLIRTVSDVSNEYVFTADPSKAVLENRSFEGKEKTAEGIEAYRYKVGVNKDHAVAYCKAISQRVLAEPATRKIANLNQAELDSAKKSVDKDCDNTARDVKADQTFDMWIDAKYKVIHKVRAYEERGGQAYVDVGQLYTGGDKLALFVTYNDEAQKAKAKLTFDVDVPGASSKADLTASSDNSSDFFGKFDVHAGVNAKPYDGEIDVTTPAGAVPIEEILKKFGLDPTGISNVQPVPDEPGTGLRLNAN